MMLHGAMNGRASKRTSSNASLPSCDPDVVVLDKLGAHKVARVRDLVEARGARLVFLPSYSPDFNPIEHAWSKLKALLRKAGAHDAEACACASCLSPRHHTR